MIMPRMILTDIFIVGGQLKAATGVELPNTTPVNLLPWGLVSNLRRLEILSAPDQFLVRNQQVHPAFV